MSSRSNYTLRAPGRLLRFPSSPAAAAVLFDWIAVGWAAPVHAQTCSQILAAIKKEAMYCGFFCDQEKIRPLQHTYERNCMPSIIAPSLFDIDAMTLDAAPLAAPGNSGAHAAYAQ
jgi:hypothetical protein